MVFVFGASLFLPTSAQAIDQRCWEKSKCVAERAKAAYIQMDQKPEDGFIQSAETLEACGSAKKISDTEEEPLGFCMPVGRTETKIGIGGRRKFSDIGDFIRYTYRYAIMVAGVVSVLMIVVAGFQWATSGGNASLIQSARKRIEGALMGLTIAVLSYSILNFVNPNLVNFRLPEIWLINKVDLPNSEFCGAGEGEENIKLAKYKSQEESLSEKDVIARKTAPYSLKSSDAQCGTLYFIDGTDGAFCHGTVCQTDFNCGRIPDGSGFDQCYPGNVIVTMQHGSGTTLQADWDFPWSNSGEEELHALCANGAQFEVSTSVTHNENEPKQLYQFIMRVTESGGLPGLQGRIENECGGIDEANFKGFFFILEMDENWDPTDEDHYIGREPKSFRALDMGDDEAWKIIAPKIKPQFLFSFAELEKTLRVDLNMTDIYDLDNGDVVGFQSAEALRPIIYQKLGIQ